MWQPPYFVVNPFLVFNSSPAKNNFPKMNQFIGSTANQFLFRSLFETLHLPIWFPLFFANHSNQIQFQTDKTHFDRFSCTILNLIGCYCSTKTNPFEIVQYWFFNTKKNKNCRKCHQKTKIFVVCRIQIFGSLHLPSEDKQTNEHTHTHTHFTIRPMWPQQWIYQQEEKQYINIYILYLINLFIHHFICNSQ